MAERQRVGQPTTISVAPEIIPTTDERGMVRGVTRQEAYEREHGLIHTVRVLILNKQRTAMLLQIRGLEKTDWPSLYSGSVSGHVNFVEETKRAETPFEAARRELREELNFIGNEDVFQFATEIEPIGNRRDLRKQVTTFVLLHDGVFPEGGFEYNQNEIAGLEWISQAELKRMLKVHPEQFTPGIRTFLQRHLNELLPPKVK